MKIFFSPRSQPDNVFTKIFTDKDPEPIYRSYPYEIKPVFDNSPFFFLNIKLKNIINALNYQEYYAAGVSFLLALIAITIVFSIVVILVPLYHFRKDELRGASGWFRPAVYFSLLGLAFMMVEICFVQKFILFLGTPTYSFSVIIFSILVFSGIGSFVSGRVSSEKNAWVFLPLGIYVFSCAFFLDSLFHTLVYAPIAVKIAASVLVIAPAAFLMGMPFPLGARRITAWKSSVLPWMWGINGVMAILSSSLTALLSLYFGFKTVFLVSSLLYLAAILFSQKIAGGENSTGLQHNRVGQEI